MTVETLLEYDKSKRPSLHRRTRLDAGKQFLTNLLYMVDLADTMKMIVPFYWNPGKTIIDVTAGKRIIWKHFGYNYKSPCGFKHWDIEFNDMSEDEDADYHIEAQKIDSLGKHYDILVCDFPFTELKNGVESFGVKSRREFNNAASCTKPQRFRRDFYFRNFIPLNELFPQCVRAFNKVADNLIIKIGDSHQKKILRKNHVYAINSFDTEFNPQSEFHLIDCVHYRGNYQRRGGRFPFAQSVVSYYLIFKKDENSR